MEENVVKQRIKLFMEQCGISVYTLSAKTNVSNTAIYQWLEDGKGIGKLVLNTINAYPNLSLEWLFRGTGEMILSESTKNTCKENLANDYAQNVPAERYAAAVAISDDRLAQIEKLNKRIEELTKEIAVKDYLLNAAGVEYIK